jgi:hypothetical protein
MTRTWNVSLDLLGADSLNPDRRVFLGVPTYPEAVSIFREAVDQAHRDGHEHGHVCIWRLEPGSPGILDTKLSW